MKSFEQLLDAYAELTVKSGLNLQPGQQLLITAPLEAVELVRRITSHAYRAGATLVTTLYSDEVATLMRFTEGQDASFDAAPGWLFNGMAEAFRDGQCARLAIIGEDPGLLSGIDPALVSRANKARSMAYKPVIDLITGFRTNWCVISCATPQLAKSVYPGEAPDTALAKLWSAIFKCTRAEMDDPVKAWEDHTRALHIRTARLNDKRFAALAYKGPGTDLTLGLVDNHLWAGGAGRAESGILFNPNIPTEEVFTMPHRERADGIVRATKPLSYLGAMIENIEVKFENGRIVKANASRGIDLFEKLISTDEGAARLGEVALVPHSSPVSATGLVFNETLYDENAASHIALGQAYAQNLKGVEALSPEERLARGMNSSIIHVDWMIGSSELHVDGISKDGKREPLMRNGEWVD